MLRQELAGRHPVGRAREEEDRDSIQIRTRSSKQAFQRPAQFPGLLKVTKNLSNQMSVLKPKLVNVYLPFFTL